MDEINNLLHYADIAFENKQYPESLAQFEKAINADPNNLYALSRAGAICVSLGKFDLALEYFERARAIEPQNGDNHFNFANACFFNKCYAKAFAAYVEAERVGCSDDVTPRLYYQMALLCSLRQDAKSALLYFRKCEDSDPAGTWALRPDLISEKLKLYMASKDYGKAEKAAAQLVAIQPSSFRYYMVYYSILMAHKNYTAAEQLLNDAERYAETTQEDRFNLLLQKASLYVAEGETYKEQRESLFSQAINLLETKYTDNSLNETQLNFLLLTLAEVYQKADMDEKTIACLNHLLDNVNSKDVVISQHDATADLEPIIDDTDEKLQNDMEMIQNKIDAGEIDEDMGAYAQVEYDESGYPLNVYGDAFKGIEAETKEDRNYNSVSSVKKQDILTKGQRERAWFLLVTAYLKKNDYEKAGKLASLLKNSDDRSYAYYGMYVSAFTVRKLQPGAAAEKKYAEALAFFRGKMFADHSDSLAAIFRARLYAEDGKKQKAREIAELLSDADRKEVLDYVDSLKETEE